MMKTEYTANGGFLQRDSVEHEEYAEAYSTESGEVDRKDGADLLEAVLNRDNLNRAYKRVKTNKGASGVDGMTIDEALSWLKEHKDELLMNMLREDIKDKRLIELIKKYLKSGVMENGIVMETKEGSPQGGNLSPLLANIYLDEFDKEFESRGVKVIRYADDILLLAKSIRAAERLLGTSTPSLEKKLKFKVNTEKSRAVSVYSIRNFGFSALRWEGTERVHISEFTQSRGRKPKINCAD